MHHASTIHPPAAVLQACDSRRFKGELRFIVVSLSLRHGQPIAGQLPGLLGGIVGTVEDGMAVDCLGCLGGGSVVKAR